MSFASITDLQNRLPVFSNSSYTDKVILSTLSAASQEIEMKLADTYSAPISNTATGGVELTANPVAGETLTIGSQVYTFVSGTPTAEDEVKIGSTKEDTALNIHSAINNLSTGEYHTSTGINTTVYSLRDSAIITLYARKAGDEGNNTGLTTDSANITLTAFTGGSRTFEILILMNCWKAASILMAGQSVSALSGSSTGNARSDYDDLLESGYNSIRSGTLTDSTGTALSKISGAPVSSPSGSYPIADMSDPINWAHDTTRDFDR